MPLMSPESQIEELLNESVESARARERSTFDESTAPFQNKLVLFGAGNLGRKVQRVLRNHGIEPLAFCDNKAALWGTEIDGTQVLSPADAAKRFGNSAAFVICIFSPGTELVSVRKQLQSLSCQKTAPFLSLFWKYPDECLPHVQLDLPQRVLGKKSGIRRVFDLLGDDASRREYVGQIRWRLWQDFDALLPRITEWQYFPEDLFTLEANEVFIDCGAFDGDTIREILKRRTDFKTIVGYEPDPGTFGRLTDYVAGLPEPMRKKFSLRRSGVGAEKGVVRFDAIGTVSSKISDSGTVEIECAALDDLLADDIHPTYIKMDIEGAELAALKGAPRILSKGDAIWAVCVYHEPDDLWQLPLYISEHTENYRFFMRKYVPEVWETVCYAVPERRLASSRSGTV